MSRLQSAADYHRELGALQGMIAEEERLAAEYGSDPAAEIAVAAMKGRFSALQAELGSLGRKTERREELAVIFDGKPVRDHTVGAAFLGKALVGLQKVLSAMVGSAAGLKTRAASLPEKIQRRSLLRVSAAFGGSFGVVFETPPEEATLFEDPSSVGNTLKALLNLVQQEEGTDLLDALEPLNSRARKRYIELLTHLEKHGADMRVEWSAPEGPKRASIRAVQAQKLRERLSKVTETEQLRRYRGTLDGALKNRAVFEFTTDDGVVFAGRLGPGVINKLKLFHYEEPCEALITTRKVVDAATGNERVFHRLEHLHPLGQDFGDLE